MENKNLIALIIYYFVRQSILSKDQLFGIDRLLSKLETDTLESICSDLDIKYN